MSNLRECLFSGWPGCSSHSCIVTGPKKGMGTNGPCHCLSDASRAQINILQGRLLILILEEERGQEAKE